MDETLRHQRDTSLGQLEALIRRGREIRHTLAVDATRAWQQDCAAAINQLSGGSKAHWLARAYSGAFLVRSAHGGVVVEADAAEIVDRILDVLAQGATSLRGMDDVAEGSGGPDSPPLHSGAAPRPRQFEFVHNVELRPVLERAFADSRDAFDRGEFGLALILSCGVIEAVLTDALDQRAAGIGQQAELDQGRGGPSASAEVGSRSDPTNQRLPGGPLLRSAPADRRSAQREGWSGPPAADSRIADWPFDSRIAAAERAKLIRGGCARLPPVARTYRDLTDAAGELRADAPVSERDARVAGQVLRVVMRDLDPGR